ncbi:UV-endonuclease UvdE-domain-containing protein [Xylaria cubensis]|nr:UV-endonuclease UvdE-domain-containing protein [Xylaria cubensis]
MRGNIRCLVFRYQAESGRHFGHPAPASPHHISRHFLAVSQLSTMGSKRKRTSMALMPKETSAQENSMDDNYQGQASEGPRRSGRLLDRAGQSLRAGQTELTATATQTEPGQSKVKRGMPISRDGADVALSGLQEMEDQLRNEVKRQKIAIQESDVKANELDEEHAALMPRPIKAQPDVLSPGKERKSLTRRGAGPKGDERARPDGVKGSRRLLDDGDLDNALEENETKIMKQEGARPPPVNSDYLPLPWKGRLGYACLNTYLRNSNPPVFSSRTCRISSIIENRHPLQDPSQPAHAVKNRPDKEQPADIERGRRYLEDLGLANARDIVKMVRWNDKYGIKFMRLSSEMFPFASHEEYGYKLAPFASEVLAEAGKVAGKLGHRLTTHPGQFTQLGSPRDVVVKNAVRDLEYHSEMLSLLQLPKQQDKDAVMILHMGGVFGDKAATLDRFRTNYGKLSDGIKARLVLENDDVSWTVHDLLPICEELNIPLVLDYHHHNIMFDKDKIREGTKDIMELYPRIKATWDRKGITQKMHYSEPCPEAMTPRQRRKHRPRVMALPPCPDTMDLMIEAKDKEQAVFELMRTYRLPGWDTFNDVIPYERADENRPLPKTPKKKKQQRKKKAAKNEDEVDDDADGEVDGEPKPPPEVPEAELGMGGPENRVYWPVGMEEWLRPQKREVKRKHKSSDEVSREY